MPTCPASSHSIEADLCHMPNPIRIGETPIQSARLALIGVGFPSVRAKRQYAADEWQSQGSLHERLRLGKKVETIECKRCKKDDAEKNVAPLKPKEDQGWRAQERQHQYCQACGATEGLHPCLGEEREVYRN